jgi:hypothetical protein
VKVRSNLNQAQAAAIQQWQGSANQALANIRMMPAETRVAMFELLEATFCRTCGWELHPRQDVCPCAEWFKQQLAAAS